MKTLCLCGFLLPYFTIRQAILQICSDDFSDFALASVSPLALFAEEGGLPEARGSQGWPGGARRSQEEPGGAWRSQEELGGARRNLEERGGSRRSLEEPGGPRGTQGETVVS